MIKAILGAAVSAALLTSTASFASGGQYEVTITNLTRGIQFTPILVSSHRGHVSTFEAGTEASVEFAALAEGGDTAPLAAQLHANPRVKGVNQSVGLLDPGQSVTVMVSAKHGAKRISVASMMLPTNDGFIGLSNVRAPRRGTKTYFSPGYDAGSEPNDELCVSIPGPVCGGAGGSPGVGGEGNVHINAGIHGIGDLTPAAYDWRNPTAKITIRRVH